MSISAQPSAESAPPAAGAARSGDTATDRLVESNGACAAEFTDPEVDARPDVHRELGLDPGDRHAGRDPGGVVTDDVIKSHNRTGTSFGASSSA